jgi:hypothetical protein
VEEWLAGKYGCLHCVVCRTGFHGRQRAEVFSLVAPFAATDAPVVLGICRRCAAECDDAALRSATIELLRSAYPSTICVDGGEHDTA